MTGRKTISKVVTTVVATLTLIAGLTLVATPASAVQVPPLTPEQIAQGWVRDQYPGCTVDRQFDGTKLSVTMQADCPGDVAYVAYAGGPAGEVRGRTNVAAPTALAASCYSQGDRLWGYMIYYDSMSYVVGGWGTRQMGRCLTGVPDSTLIPPASTKPETSKSCKAQGKVFKRLKGRALKRARKLGLPTRVCVKPRWRKSITS
jgi:hypothetical protein